LASDADEIKEVLPEFGMGIHTIEEANSAESSPTISPSELSKRSGKQMEVSFMIKLQRTLSEQI
jgi:hypothetical protein